MPDFSDIKLYIISLMFAFNNIFLFPFETPPNCFVFCHFVQTILPFLETSYLQLISIKENKKIY